MRWLVLAALLWPGAGQGATVADLVRAYPELLAGFDGANIVWRDGTRMAVGAARPDLPPEQRMSGASIADQLAIPYPAGAPLDAPADDPGRLRNRALFDRMYGDCHAGTVAPNLVRITWLPRSWGRTVSIQSVNGMDRHLQAVSRELDELPAEERRHAFPIAGTYNCRNIAGTDQVSMHGWGAAIDLNTGYSDYWRWTRPPGDPPPFRNRMPESIVRIFEKHGFIWGGRWAHFDTMHFEYRPELLPGFDPAGD